MTIKDASSSVFAVVSDLQAEVSGIQTAMGKASTVEELRALGQQADRLRTATENLQRAALILLPLAREIELNAEAKALAAEQLAK